MKTRDAFILLLFFYIPVCSFGAGEGSFLIRKTPQYTLWWSVGTYKVNKTELPSVSKEIKISAARNEYESFQLVIHPEERIDNFRIKMSSLSGGKGVIDATNSKVYDVDYVYVKKPTSKGTAPGWYPDPIPPDQGPRILYPLENYPFFIDVYIPETTPSGTYNGQVILSWGEQTDTVPFSLVVYDFSLPRTTTLRSSFGINPQAIRQYHNLQTDEELKEVYDMYMQELRADRICSTSPFDLYPMKVSFTGIDWEGGTFDRSRKTEGLYAYKVEDASYKQNVCATSKRRISVKPHTGYTLSWNALCKEKQQYAVSVRFYDPEGNRMMYDNILNVYPGDTTWNHVSFNISALPDDVAEAEVVLYASFPTVDGSSTGTTWFDNVRFTEGEQPENLLSQGNFEVDISKINVSVDFSEFDKAGERYIDDFGFNAFHLPIQGMGGGTFYSRQYGVFAGFMQRTPEYDNLMKSYLSQVEKHLQTKGWLGKEYVYWFDEPGKNDYDFVREGMNVLKNSAPRIKRFITEHQPGPQIMDVSDIGCTVWDRINPQMIDSLGKKGREFWSYLCTGPKAPWVNLFIDQDAINLRMWCWMTYQYKLKGILIWSANYWNSNELSEDGRLQNPWEDPMSYVTGYGSPLGFVRCWGNGDGRLLYPPNRDVNGDKQKFMEGPVRSIRLAILRDGIEDYEYFVLLQKLRDNLNPRKDKDLIAQADSLLQFDGSFFTRGDQYTKNPLVLYERRQAIASLIEVLQKKTKKD